VLHCPAHAGLVVLIVKIKAQQELALMTLSHTLHLEVVHGSLLGSQYSGASSCFYLIFGLFSEETSFDNDREFGELALTEHFVVA